MESPQNSSTTPSVRKKFQLSGTVTNKLGEGLAGIKVSALNVTFTGAAVYNTVTRLPKGRKSKEFYALGKATTDDNGNYTIGFTSNDYHDAGTDWPDIIVYSYDDHTITGRSALLNGQSLVKTGAATNLNITISNTIQRGISEFRTLDDIVDAYITRYQVELYQMNGATDQIGYLAEKTGQSAANIGILVQAAALQHSAAIQQATASQQPQATKQAAPSQHTGTAIDLQLELLYGLGRQKVSLNWAALMQKTAASLSTALTASIAANIIAPYTQAAIDSFLANLAKAVSANALSDPTSGTATALGKALGITLKDNTVLQQTFSATLQAYRSDPATFWQQLQAQPGFVGNAGLVGALQYTNQLVALTGNNLDLVTLLQANPQITQPQQLLTMTISDWQALLAKTTIPDGIPGASTEEKTANYIKGMQTLLNMAFPTQTIAAMLAGNGLPYLQNNQPLVADLQMLFKNTPDFDISSSIVDKLPAAAFVGIAAGDQAAVKTELKKIQRIFQVSPDPTTMAVLLAAGYQSSKQIASTPIQTFVAQNTNTMGAATAKAVYTRATYQVARLQKAMIGLYEVTTNAQIYATTYGAQANAVAQQIQASIPDWANLFGDTSLCQCQDCMSVLSPSAYLVEMLQFLDSIAIGSSTLGGMLSVRRPDIQYLPLTCENTNTVLPYIDLVNEVMEYYIVHSGLDQGAAYDTGTETTDELYACPQNTLPEAYCTIKNAVYPFTLPYHQPLDCIKIFLAQLNTDRYTLMTTFNPAATAATLAGPLAADLLRLSPEKYAIVSSPLDFSAAGVAAGSLGSLATFYGLSGAAALTTLVQVDTFLTQTGIQYTDLITLVKTAFINPGQPALGYLDTLMTNAGSGANPISVDPVAFYTAIQQLSIGAAGSQANTLLNQVLGANQLTIASFTTWVNANFATLDQVITLFEPDSGCDLSTTSLMSIQKIYDNGFKDSTTTFNGVPASTFDRMHRFIRLWKAVGWKIHELDNLITALGAADLTGDVLSAIANAILVNRQLGLPPDSLACFWGPIPHMSSKSLYQRLFLSKSIPKINSVFLPDMQGNYFGGNPVPPLASFLPSICAALGITEPDLNSILGDAFGGNPLVPLNFQNLGILYGYQLLATALSLSVNDLIDVKQLFYPGLFASPADTKAFLDLWNDIGTSGFSVPLLNYIIRGEADNPFNFLLADHTLEQTIQAISAGFGEIELDNPDTDLTSGASNVNETFLNGKLQLIYSSPVVTQLLSILDGSIVFSISTDKNVGIPAGAVSSYIGYNPVTGILSCTGVMSTTDQAALLAINGISATFQAAVNSLFSQGPVQCQQFFANNFSGFLPAAQYAAFTVAPATLTPATLQRQFLNFYMLFLPFLKTQLRQNTLVQNVSSLAGIDELTTTAILAPNWNPLIAICRQQGLTGIYSNNANPTQGIGWSEDGTIDFINTPQTAPPFTWAGVQRIQVPAAPFSIRWEGLLTSPGAAGTTQTCTLIVDLGGATQVCGIRVGGKQLAFTGGGTPTTTFTSLNLYGGIATAIVLEYQVNATGGDNSIQLSWEIGGGAKRLIPGSALTPPSAALTRLAATTGLLGHYYTGVNFSGLAFARIDPVIQFDWGNAATNTVPANNFTVLWEGALLPAISDTYTLTADLSQADQTITLSIDGSQLATPNPVNTAAGQHEYSWSVPLTGGKLSGISLTLTAAATLNSGIQFYWQTATMPKTIIPGSALFPQDQLQTLTHWLRVYYKAGQFIGGFALTATEVAYFISHAPNFSGIDFVGISSAQWERMNAYTTLRTTLNPQPNALIGVFSVAQALISLPAASQPPLSVLLTLISQVAGWDNGTLTTFVTNYNWTTASFVNEVYLTYLNAMMAQVTTTGAPAAKLLYWSVPYFSGYNFGTNPPSLPAYLPQGTSTMAQFLTLSGADQLFYVLNDIAYDVRSTVRAIYSPADWLTVSKSLSNTLRTDQRDALVAYLLTLPAIIGAGCLTADDLFGYFLIDVQMDSCMDTSRIRQALNSVQLYVNRCLWNLEKDTANNPIAPSVIDLTVWSWMQYYDVWGSAREIFLFPENWLDPSLRTDMTPFFQDLVSTLLQNDITADTVEDALRAYLDSLQQVSNLEICGVFQQNMDPASASTNLAEPGISQNNYTMHVFARTLGAPYVYYYRALDVYNHWSAWEKIPVDIHGVDSQGGSNNLSSNGDLNTYTPPSGVHLVPVIWKNRLFLFWPEFVKKQMQIQNDQSIIYSNNQEQGQISAQNQPSYWAMRLGWSEYKNGTWTPKQLSNEEFQLTRLLQAQELLDRNTNALISTQESIQSADQLYFVTSIDSADNLTIYIRECAEVSDSGEDYARGFGWFAQNYNSYNFALSGMNMPINFSSYPDNQTENDINYNEWILQYQSFNGGGELVLGNATFLKEGGSYRIIYSRDNQIFFTSSLFQTPFFYWDGAASFFVQPQNVQTVQYVLQKPGSSSWLNDGAEENGYIYSSPADATSSPYDFGMSAVDSRSSNMTYGLASRGGGRSGAAATLAKSKTGYTGYTNTIATAFGGLTTGYQGPAGFLQNVYYPELAFNTFFHPFTEQFLRRLNINGIDSLLFSDLTKYLDDDKPSPQILADDQGNTFINNYSPNFGPDLVFDPPDLTTSPLKTYFKLHMDFDEFGAYSIYNWELFFHAPLYIATQLSVNGRYAEAMTWFQYIFNPTSSGTPDPNNLNAGNPNAQYWQVLPLKTEPVVNITKIITNLSLGTGSLQAAEGIPGAGGDPNVTEWMQNPFDPWLVAQGRPVALMKAVVMKYLDNLIAWGDDLYTQDTIETINQATQLYIMAAQLLGPQPQFVPTRGIVEQQNYNTLKPQLNSFGDAIVQLENLFPYSSGVTQSSSLGTLPSSLMGIGQSLYFCVPNNDQLMQYWQTVGDRLFNIRHCKNIQGIDQVLALFQPPINPALLVQASAQGLNIGTVLADLDSPDPLYRFNYILQKAVEYCGEVKALGNALLSALEKNDSEALSLLRAQQEVNILNLTTEVKNRQVLEAQSNWDNLQKNRETTLFRQSYYLGLLGMSSTDVPVPAAPILPDQLDTGSSLPADTVISIIAPAPNTALVPTDQTGIKVIQLEEDELSSLDTAHTYQVATSAAETIAAIMHLLPDLATDVKPFGIGAGLTWGLSFLANASSASGRISQALSGDASFNASKSAKYASYVRREQEWTEQVNIASKEIIQLDKQIVAAQIRLQIAQHELDIHAQQIANAQAIENFLVNKFTDQQLYQWMHDQLFSVYKQSYQLAYAMAKKAEKGYRLELGVQVSSFIQYGYWNSTYQGLACGENLYLALKQMEQSYIENNAREFELTKHISLAQLDPLALLQARESGSCQFSVPEEWFDMDYPGHYFRRVKSVSISIPCVAGPYTTVNSTLRLMSNSIRINSSGGSGGAAGYSQNAGGGDPRFVSNNTPTVAIATSSAQNDSGLFELNFRDERYLPFEGAGAISNWTLELNGKYVLPEVNNGSPVDLSQFDYTTITDIIIHIKYTAREDDGTFRTNAIQNLNAYFAGGQGNLLPMARLFSMRHEFPMEWYTFLSQQQQDVNNVNYNMLNFTLDGSRFPYFASNRTIGITGIGVYIDSDTGKQGQFYFFTPANPFPATTPATANISAATATATFQQAGVYGNLWVANPDLTGQTLAPGQFTLVFAAGSGIPVDSTDLQDIYIVFSYHV